MILSEPYLQQLLKGAIEHVEAPPGCAAVIEGSIAEGFGNDSSDIDFLLIEQSDRQYAGTPTVIFVDGRRVEVRLRSTGTIEADRERLLRLGGNGGGRIPEDLLNRCQRLRNAFPLEGHALVSEVQEALPDADLKNLAFKFYAGRCRQAARLAVAMTGLGVEESSNWADIALTFGAKAWAARLGETYVETKWLSHQLDRIASGQDTISRIRRLQRSDPGPAYANAVLELLPELGVDGCANDPERVSFRRASEVTTWPIGERLHVLRSQDVFVLSATAGHVWRHVTFGRPLPQVVANIGGDSETNGRILLEFVRLGLVDLQWRTAGKISAAGNATLNPSIQRPLLSMGGAVFGDEALPIKLIPMPGKRFAAAGMALTWGHVMIENAREDAIGAIAQEQWGLFEAVMRRMLRRASLTVLSAYGVEPLPPQEEACSQLRRLAIEPKLAQSMLDLDRSLSITSKAKAKAAMGKVNRLVIEVRELTGASGFPSSFADANGWRETLEAFYDWVRVGAFLDSAFPLDDLRDVLTSVDQRQKAS